MEAVTTEVLEREHHVDLVIDGADDHIPHRGFNQGQKRRGWFSLKSGSSAEPGEPDQTAASSDLARWLMEQGIESLSLNPDTVVDTWERLARAR